MDIKEKLAQARPIFYSNPHYDPATIKPESDTRVEDASARLTRFAPYLREAFPDTAKNGGLIESPLTEIPRMAQALEKERPFSGTLWLKQDSELPISGSIKARGGIYEVLHVAEQILMKHGKLTEDSDYRVFLEPEAKELLSGYTISVGSTGNLGHEPGARLSSHRSHECRCPTVEKGQAARTRCRGHRIRGRLRGSRH